jgi:putative FmdB family regulatory protein
LEAEVPTYQYACTSCGHPLEAVQSFTDDALTECPDCGGNLRKVFSAVGIVFKGSGFYRTDSRSDKSGAPTAVVPPAQPSKESGGGSKESGGGSKESGSPASTPAPAATPASSSSSGSSSTPTKAATSS